MMKTLITIPNHFETIPVTVKRSYLPQQVGMCACVFVCVFSSRIQLNPRASSKKRPVLGTATAIIVELRSNQHARELSMLQSTARTKWNVLDNTVTATSLILITQGICLDDLRWQREETRSLLCSASNRGGTSLLPESAGPREHGSPLL